MVPAVDDGAETPAEVRPAVTYYTAKGASPGLAAESEDGTSRWTAAVVLKAATDAENAEV